MVPTAQVRVAEKDILAFLHSRHADVMTEISNSKEINGANEGKILEAVKGFLATKKY